LQGSKRIYGYGQWGDYPKDILRIVFKEEMRTLNKMQEAF
jgi:hypothetical protein